jgi:hypothetical protein
MGQLQDKCFCLKKMEDKNNLITDPKFCQTRTTEGSEYNTNGLKFSTKFSKKMNQIPNASAETHFATSSTNYVENGMRPTINFENQDHACFYIQTLYKGYKTRVHYKTYLIKQLKEHKNKLLDKYTLLLNSANLIKAEKNHIEPYDRNGWKKNFADEYLKFIFDYGFVLECKIKVIEENFSFYVGEVNLDGERHGYGTLLCKTGVKYQGHWIRDEFTGWGRHIDAQGTISEGYFENFQIQGEGERHTLSGTHYVGQFKKGLKWGQGTEETVDHHYVGRFYNDLKEGQGKLKYKKMNDEYEGQFKDNCITGHGFYKFANNDTYSGTFFKGRMHGAGVYKWPDGSEYVGQYIDNIKEGKGKFKWPNGKIFEGPFKDGKPNGVGKLLVGDDIYEVQFENGKLHKTLSKNKPSRNSLGTGLLSANAPKSPRGSVLNKSINF